MRAIHHHPQRYSVRSSILGLLFAALIGSACDCKGSSEDIDPSDVRPADLYGWWTHTDATGTVTVFGFVPKEDAARVLPIKPEEVTGDISAVYQGSRGSLPEPVQLATFEVEDGEILQTVLRDVGSTAGTRFRTRILSLKSQRELSLQSTSSTTGSRSFSWSARCPSTGPHGYFDVPGQICSSYFSSATSVSVDPRGGVHAASAIAGASASCAPGKAAAPTYSYLSDACGPTHSPLPDFRESGMITDDRSVHFAYVTQSAYDSTKEGLLFYRYRSLDQSDDWTEESVAGQGYPVHEMRILLKDGEPLIVVSRTNGVIELHRREAGTWRLVPTPLTNGTPLSGQMADATLDREGRLVLLLESSHKLAYEGAGGFELLDLPQQQGVAAGFGGGVAADDRGRIHLAYVHDEIGDNADGTGGRVVSGRGVYAVYDGTAWASHELGPVTYPRIVTRRDGPWRVVHGLEKAPFPALALTEVSEDGSLRSELITLEPSRGTGNSPEPFFHPMADMGPDGTVAAAWDGNRVYIRPPEAQLVRERARLNILIEGRGKGRVRSADGAIDCTETCSVEVPVGARYQLFFEPDGQSARDRVTCPSNYFALYGYCWYDVFAGTDHEIRVRFRESPVAAIHALGAPDSTATPTHLAARDGRVAVAANVTSSRFLMGSVELDVGTARQVLAVREADGRAWAVPLPVAPQAIGLLSDGSAAALFFSYAALTFPSGTVGDNSSPVFVLARYANGGFQQVESLASIPQQSIWVAGAIGDDDSVGGVFYNLSTFGGIGIPEHNLFAWRGAAGSTVLRGMDSTLGIASSSSVALRDGRAAVLVHGGYLVLYDGGTQTGTRRVEGGNLMDLAWGADRLYSLWGATHGSVDLGGGLMQTRSSGLFYGEHRPDGSYLSAQEVAHGGGAVAIAPAPSGAVFVGATFRGGLTYGRLLDPDYSFSFGGDPAGNKGPPALTDFDGDNFWVVVKHQGLVDYDVATIDSPFRYLLLQMRLP